VIVSHVIVLFDFIEEMHEKGEPLEQALPDAGIQRIRPVMITVLATIVTHATLESWAMQTIRWPRELPVTTHSCAIHQRPFIPNMLTEAALT
jgi:hypothetical protein